MTETATETSTETVTGTATETITETASDSPTPSATPDCANLVETRVTVAEVDLNGFTHCGAQFNPPVPGTFVSTTVGPGRYRVSMVPGLCITYNGAGTIVGAGIRWGSIVGGSSSFLGTAFQSPASPANGSCEAVWASGGMVYGSGTTDGQVELPQGGELWFIVGDSNCYDNVGDVRVRVERVTFGCASPTPTGSPSMTVTVTATQTPSQTETATPSSTETSSVTASPTPTPSSTADCGFVAGPILATGPVSAAASDRADGSFWVQSGYNPAHLLHFGPNGGLLEDRIISTSGFGTTTMTVDLDGSVLLVRGGQLYRVREGAPVLVPGVSFSGIYSVVLGPDGSLYAFEDGHQVRKLQRSGPDSWTLAWLAPLPGVAFGRTVAVLADGTVLVPVTLNSGANTLLRLSAAGLMEASLPLGYRVSGGITIGSDGMPVLNEAGWSGGTVARLHRIDPTSGAELSLSVVPVPPLNAIPAEMPLQAGADGRIFIWHQGSTQAWMAQPCLTATQTPSASPSPTMTVTAGLPCLAQSRVELLPVQTTVHAWWDPIEGKYLVLEGLDYQCSRFDDNGVLTSRTQLYVYSGPSPSYRDSVAVPGLQGFWAANAAGNLTRFNWTGSFGHFGSYADFSRVSAAPAGDLYGLKMGSNGALRRVQPVGSNALNLIWERPLGSGYALDVAGAQDGSVAVLIQGAPTNQILRFDAVGGTLTGFSVPANSGRIEFDSQGRLLLTLEGQPSAGRVTLRAFDLANGQALAQSDFGMAGSFSSDVQRGNGDQLILYRPRVDARVLILEACNLAPLSPLSAARLSLGSPKDADAVPAQAALLIAPNPFAGTGLIQASLPRAAQARVLVMDLHGAVVHSADLGALGAGVHQAPLDLRGLASGIYLAQLQLNHGEGWGLGARFKLAVVQ